MTHAHALYTYMYNVSISIYLSTVYILYTSTHQTLIETRVSRPMNKRLSQVNMTLRSQRAYPGNAWSAWSCPWSERPNLTIKTIKQDSAAAGWTLHPANPGNVRPCTMPICEPWCWNIKTYKTGWFLGVNVGIHIPAPWASQYVPCILGSPWPSWPSSQTKRCDTYSGENPTNTMGSY